MKTKPIDIMNKENERDYYYALHKQTKKREHLDKGYEINREIAQYHLRQNKVLYSNLNK